MKQSKAAYQVCVMNEVVSQVIKYCFTTIQHTPTVISSAESVPMTMHSEKWAYD